MKNKVVLTGDRPTGPLHLGHYVGSLENRVKLQEQGYEVFILIADLQALTTHVDEPKLIEESVRELALDYMSVGLNPDLDNVHFVLQSHVPKLQELASLFTMITPFGEVRRNPTVKKEMKKIKNNPEQSITTGFIIYPVSQSCRYTRV